MKVIDENENAWKLQNGLWYAKPECVFGVCPLCGSYSGGVWNVWAAHYYACDECQVAWHFGTNLMSAWKVISDEDHERAKEYISKMRDASEIYDAKPLSVEDEQQYREMYHTYEEQHYGVIRNSIPKDERLGRDEDKTDRDVSFEEFIKSFY